MLEEKTTLQKATQVLEHQLLRQESRINQILEDWRNNDENWRKMYIDHITVQVKKIVHESRRMSERVQTLIEEYYPKGNLGQCL